MRICFFAGPGAGKTATASWLFSELKIRNLKRKFELIPEFIKQWAWEKRVPESWDQFYIFATQLNYEDRVARYGVHTITDSPLWMQTAYMIRNSSVFTEECISACRKFDKSYPSFNILLKRTVPYETEGRYETIDEAMAMDDLVNKTLIDNGISFKTFDPMCREAIFESVLMELITK